MTGRAEKGRYEVDERFGVLFQRLVTQDGTISVYGDWLVWAGDTPGTLLFSEISVRSMVGTAGWLDRRFSTLRSLTWLITLRWRRKNDQPELYVLLETSLGFYRFRLRLRPGTSRAARKLARLVNRKSKVYAED